MELDIVILILAIGPVIAGPFYMWWTERPPRPSKNQGHEGLDGTTITGFAAASGGCV